MKIIYVNCGLRNEFESVRLRYRCSALTTELTSQLWELVIMLARNKPVK